MDDFGLTLARLYAPLISWCGLGYALGRWCSPQIPDRLGKVLFWVGVPLSIIVFLRQADLSGALWLAPVAAWGAILLGLGLAWLWLWLTSQRQGIPLESRSLWPAATQGSFLLAAMVGNTGYIGYPVVLALTGTQYFAWALFYDLLGTVLGSYGLGVLLAYKFGAIEHRHPWQLTQSVLIQNPALWSVVIGLLSRPLIAPVWVERGLGGLAWAAIAASLLLIGMRLGQVSSWRSIPRAAVTVGIKMLVVPLVLGLLLTMAAIPSQAHLVLVLQMAMPPAFATLVLAEAFELDRELTVTALAIGSLGLFAFLPLWLQLFS